MSDRILASEPWRRLLGRSDVLIVDTETTGLGEGSEIVDIAVIDTTGRVLYDEVVMPKGKISAKASAVHGLSRDSLRRQGAVGWEEHHEPILRLLAGAVVVLAYNAEFDRRQIAQSAMASRQPQAKGINWRCLMEDYADWRSELAGGERRWHRLEDAYSREVGRDIDQEHRALADCRMSLELMKAVTALDAGQLGEKAPRPERSYTLDRYIGQYIREGWQLQARENGRAVLTRNPKPKHLLHLCLTIATMGFWGIVWLALALSAGGAAGEQVALSVDSRGELRLQVLRR